MSVRQRGKKDIAGMSATLEVFLFVLRYEGVVKIKCKALMAELAKRKLLFVNDRTMRDLLNYLKKHKRPVGSSVKGYFAILKSDEYNEPIRELVSRARDIEEQIREMKEAQQEMWKQEEALRAKGGKTLFEAQA